MSINVQGLGLKGTKNQDQQWNNVPVAVQNEIDALVVQWVQQTGGAYVPSVGDLLYLQSAKDLSAESVAQYLYGKMGSVAQTQMPWAATGLDRDSYMSASQQFQTMYETLTGQQMSVQQVQQAMQQGYTASTYRDFLMADKNTLNTYGWLKYGYNYQQFQTYKEGLKQSFGGTLDDKQAIMQLQYLHSASSSGPTATARQPARQGQTPVEQTQSEVR